MLIHLATNIFLARTSSKLCFHFINIAYVYGKFVYDMKEFKLPILIGALFWLFIEIYVLNIIMSMIYLFYLKEKGYSDTLETMPNGVLILSCEQN